MRASAKVGSAAGAVVVLLAGYATLDVYDVVPGVLTRSDAARPAVPQPGHAHVGPIVLGPEAPAAPVVRTGSIGPIPATAALAARVRKALGTRGFPPTVAVTIRDGASGAHLYDQGAGTAVTPASVTKLLTAYAIAQTIPAETTFTTKVVAGPGGSLVLVAGGDTCLNPKDGDPNAVCGRAGVGDLAAQLASTLKKAHRNKVSLSYDASYDPGPLTAPGWSPDLLTSGYTTRIAQLGLSTQHAETGPAVANPDASTTAALAAALKARGITTTVGAAGNAPVGATGLASVQSAPLVDQLGFALQQSDNAMVEALARQAAYRAGVAATSEAAVTGWVEKVLRSKGFDLTGVKLADVCGLSDGTSVPVRLLGDLLTRATTGKDPAYADVLTHLPVGGWNGTLAGRFRTSASSAAAGYVRAKTGSLTGVGSLAGTVVDLDGRLIVFAIVTNGGQPLGPNGARAAIDAVIAAIHECGCR